MSQRTLWWFMAITFGLGWGIGAMLFLFTDQIEALFGPVSGTNPVFILLVWSPAIAGIVLVWRHHGRSGIRSFLRRLTLWKSATTTTELDAEQADSMMRLMEMLEDLDDVQYVYSNADIPDEILAHL
jgi:hypothetical protein